MDLRSAHPRAAPPDGPAPPDSPAPSEAVAVPLPLPPLPLRRLVAAECAAEAAAAGEEAEELQQAVWLRWFEAAARARARESGEAYGGVTEVPTERWLRAAVRAEARSTRRRGRRETTLPYGGPIGAPAAESTVLAAEQRTLLDAALSRLPGRCPSLMRAMFSGRDLTYPEIADELGMSQGSVGPVRSRCLACLRRMLRLTDCVP